LPRIQTLGIKETDDDHRPRFGQYGECIAATSFDGAGTAQLWHPNERKKNLFSNEFPTFVHSRNNQTLAQQGFRATQELFHVDEEGNYYHANGAPVNMEAMFGTEVMPFAEAEDVPSDKPRSAKKRGKRVTTVRPALRSSRPSSNQSQGGGGGPRSSNKVNKAAIIRRVKPKFESYPRQERAIHGYYGYPGRFNVAKVNDRFDRTTMTTIDYNANLHDNKGNDQDHYGRYLSNHTNIRPTAH